MWSDPDDDMQGFSLSQRGAGFIFGRDVCEKFLYENDMNKVYRAHQLCKDGYQIVFEGKLATVWSAPNYCHRYENLASILELDEHLNEYFNIFEDAPENTREKKVEKPRDVNQFGVNSIRSRQSTASSSASSGRNGGGRRQDYFM